VWAANGGSAASPRLQRLKHLAVCPKAVQGSLGCWSVNQLAQIVHYQMRAMAPKLIGISFARDADHKAEVPVGPGLHSREGVLNDNRSSRLNSEQFCRRQIRIRGGFPRQFLRMNHVAIDLYVEDAIQFGGL